MSTYPIYGREHIEQGALDQMNTAMQLPIAVAGALMPDAHVGYGLPIGGVLATRADTIIPYAVGVDIACRMCLSVYDIPAERFDEHRRELHAMLLKHTHFGLGSTTKEHHDTSLFDRPEWSATKAIRDLKDRAYHQLGTSGTGNHFAEWGILSVESDENETLPKGSYVALLTHSGSRGFGGNLASMYSKIAMQNSGLPEEAKHLAWLDMHSEAGQEYWIAMNLAGEYAKANHHEIHGKISHAMQLEPRLMVENHHNFAWLEHLADGTEVMVHRKGATPAGEGVMGIIPGSMSTPGFVVRGKGHAPSLHSASHGAGRRMSRGVAHRTVDRHAWKQMLRDHDVTLIGSDVDEAPMVYKNIHDVMAAQEALVDVVATFQPRIVRMASAKERPED